VKALHHVPLSSRRRTALSILLLLTISITLIPILPVYSAVYNIFLEPSENSFDTSTTPLGYTWDVAILVQNTTKTGIAAYQVKLYFNPAHVIVMDAWLPKTDPSWVFNKTKETKSLTPVIDNFAGYVLINASIITGDAFIGTGKLAIIRFKIVGVPPEGGELSSDFAINNPDTVLKDKNGVVMESNPIKGAFKYFWPPKLLSTRMYLAPSDNEFSSAKTAVGYNWDVSVWVRNVTDLSSYHVKLYFNPSHVIAFTEMRLFNTTFLNFTQPLSAEWLEQEPLLSQRWILTVWSDDNKTGSNSERLGEGDAVKMRNLETQAEVFWVVKGSIIWNAQNGAYEMVLKSVWRADRDTTWVFYSKTSLLPTLIIDNALGYVRTNSSVTTAFTGTGKLLLITFRIVGSSPQYDELSSPFSINNTDTYLRNRDGTQIPCLKYNGSFKYVGHPPPARVDMYPSQNMFSTTTTSVGYEWNVTVSVKNATDIASYQVKLNFNSSHVNVVGASIPKTDSSWVFYGKSTTLPSPVIDNVAGYTLINDSIVSGEPFSGTGKLATIRFRITNAPPKEDNALSSAFAINNPDTFLKDKNGELILTTKKYDGSFRYAWFPKPPPTSVYVDPSINTFSTATTSVGYEWNVTVWVKNVTGLDSYNLKLYFNPAYVNAVGAQLPKNDPSWVFYGRGTVGLSPEINAVKGYVLVGDTILSGATFTGQLGKLAIIKFKITSVPDKFETLSAFFSINNIDTFLQDSEQRSISATKVDGSFEYIWSAPATKPNVAVRRADGQPWPLEFGSSPTPTGQAFDVNVLIENLDAEWGLIEANVSIAYNASIIDIVGKEANVTVDASKWTVTKLAVNYNADPTLDNVTIYVKPISPWVPNGTVLVATVKFTVVYFGPWGIDIISPIDFIENVLVDDPGPALIPQNPAINGQFVIRGMTLEVRFPPHALGQNQFITNKLETFSVEVWLNELTIDKRLIGAQFRLKYNATLLKFLNVTEGSFLSSFPNSPSPPYTLFTWYNESIGVYGPNVLVGIVLFPNATWQYHNFPSGSGILATVTLQGIYRGVYPPEMMNATLELVDILLVDDQYNPIATTPIHGHYGIWSYKSPIVAFTHSPSVVNATSPVVFNASDSFDFGLGHIANYRWDFDDGTNATVTDTAVEHVYMLPGTYTVNLTVTDDDGQTNSTVRILEVFKLTSALSMEIKPSTINFSQTTTINGTISPKRATASVNIQYRLAGELGWRTLAIMVTDTQGRYTFTWTPTKETAELSDTFELRASWLGDEVTESAQATATLEVKMARSTLTINLNPSTLNVGSKVTISGTLSPMQSGNVNVSITYRLRGGVWLPLTTVRTNSSGNYNYTWTTREAGIYEVRTDFTGDANAGPTQSQIATLTINKETSKVEIYVYPSKAIAGSNVSVYGKVLPIRQGVNVTIFYRSLNGPWQILAVVKTSNESRYSTTWKITEIGTYEVRASWQGDLNALPSESSEKTFTVEAQPTEILLYIMITIIIVTITIGIIAYYKKLRKHKPQPPELIQP